jgi:serine/threonine protein kinase
VKLLDFGLAKPVGGDAELTRSGAVIGTPAYMSPEQARARPVDHRTDLFSLGAVLYRLATGRNPFVGPNPVAVLLALGTEEPAPVRDLNPEVPEPLAALVHQLLSKAPEHRPQTAAEVAARLHAVLELPATAGRAAVSPLSRPVAVPARADAGAEDVFAGLVDDIEGDDTTRLEESDQPPRAGGAPIEPSSSPRPGPC